MMIIALIILLATAQLMQGATAQLMQGTHTMKWGIVRSAQASSACDNFNRADGSLGVNWSIPLASECPMILTNNQVRSTVANSNAYAIWSASTFTGDQFTQQRINGTNFWNGGCVRNDSSVGNMWVGYLDNLGPINSAALDVYLGGLNPGNNSYYTQLAVYQNTTWATGDVIRTEVYGSALPVRIYLYHNGVPFGEYLDFTNLVVGGQPGIGIHYTANDAVTNLLDDWCGGNVTSPSTASDNFTRADSEVLGSNWVSTLAGFGYDTHPYASFSISGNKAVPRVSSSFAIAVWGPTEFASSLFSQTTIGSGQGTLDYVGAVARCSYTNTSGNTFYLAFAYGTLPTTALYFYEFDGATYNLLKSDTSTTWSAGDVLRLEATGTNPVLLEVKRNGVSVTTHSDSTYKLTGSRAGIGAYKQNGTPTISAWSGGNL